MRQRAALAAAAALIVSLGMLAATRSSTLAQDAPTGQERFVVFETFGDTG